MNGVQLMQLGKTCAAAQTNIPLNLTPTVPRLMWKDGWVAEYWYYFFSDTDFAIYAPRYYMALRVVGGWPEEMRRLSGAQNCLGDSTDLFDPGFRARQMAYLNRCADMITQTKPNQKQLNDLAEEWLRTLPAPLRAWFGKTNEPQHPAADAEAAEPSPHSLPEYWEKEMAEAIRAGDYERAEKAQKEMKKARKQKQR